MKPGSNRGASRRPDVVVVFGAIHTSIPAPAAMMCSADAWAEPGGISPVHGELEAKLKERSGLFAVDDRFHQHEHAVEVELPLIQSAWPGVSILPVEVPLSDAAAEMGRCTARQVTAAGLKAVFLASSDLTHYGPGYRFAPAGVGPRGLAWAKDNDRMLLDLVETMAADAIVPHVREHSNACGGGAIAAMLAACLESGATSARLLRHANSFETLATVAPQRPIDAVGYAAVVVG
jgi:AmmeMemoRadiSam system protein B